MLGPTLTVPANSSRFMGTVEEARREPTARLALAWRDDDPYVFNAAFDPTLIRHDDSYCTTVVDLDGRVQLPTLDHFDAVASLVDGDRIIDIGCGRGEFVDALRARGFVSIGYDPVLKADTEHLRARYWTPADERADLYVMRCVLPHIPDPWSWIRAMGEMHPEALLLVEYQRLEWMVEHGIWYQLCHDHVNQFRAADFLARFEVFADGEFKGGEWGWTLLRPSSYRDPAMGGDPPDLSTLFARRDSDLDAPGVVVPWGAAGKGIVLAHALLQAGAEVPYAIDADPGRQGLHMEVSGVPILDPRRGVELLPRDGRVWVCNPNHAADVAAFMATVS
jgi:hypothetical protein